MATNKVEFGGKTLIDLTEDTVTPETLLENITAHDKSGKLITGTIANDYLNRFDLKYFVTGTFQPSSDVRTLSIENAGLNGRTPKIIVVQMTNTSAYQDSTLYFISGYYINLNSKETGWNIGRAPRYSSSTGLYGLANNDSVEIIPKANGFTINTNSHSSLDIYITKTKGYRYHCVG